MKKRGYRAEGEGGERCGNKSRGPQKTGPTTGGDKGAGGGKAKSPWKLGRLFTPTFGASVGGGVRCGTGRGYTTEDNQEEDSCKG